MEIFPLDNQVGEDALFPKRPTVLLLCAKPASGKTSIIINMLLQPDAYQGYFDQIYIFSKNYHSDEKQMMLGKFAVLSGNRPVPDTCVFTSYDPATVKEITDKLKKPSKTLFLFDDMALKVSNDPFMQEIMINRRHMGLSVWITGQRLKLFSKATRTMADSFIISNLSTASERRESFDDVAGNYGLTMSDYNDILDYCAKQPYGFLYANGRKLYCKFNEEFETF